MNCNDARQGQGILHNKQKNHGQIHVVAVHDAKRESKCNDIFVDMSNRANRLVMCTVHFNRFQTPNGMVIYVFRLAGREAVMIRKSFHGPCDLA